MKQRCLACGVEKDASIKEVYPYPEDGLIDDPIEPFMSIDCGGFGPGWSDWRVVTVCHDCFHKLDVDMWISESCWQSLNLITPYEQLPKLETK
jgi:hypothetical protein